MNADKVLKAIQYAEEMCHSVIDYFDDYEELLPKKYSNEACGKIKVSTRMYSIMDGLNFEYNAVELDNEADIERVHGYAVSVLREASSTLAKMKALVQANKQEIEYCDFA